MVLCAYEFHRLESSSYGQLGKLENAACSYTCQCENNVCGPGEVAQCVRAFATQA